MTMSSVSYFIPRVHIGGKNNNKKTRSERIKKKKKKDAKDMRKAEIRTRKNLLAVG